MTLTIRYCVFIVFILLFGRLCDAASFDCQLASTEVERMICNDLQLSQSDSELSVLYANVLRNTTDKESVRLKQRNWLKKVRNICTNTPCIERAYATRAAELGIPKSADNEQVIALGATDQSVSIQGATPDERIAFLVAVEKQAEEQGDIEYRNKYFSKALYDSSLEVREFAAYGLRGSRYVEQMIHVLTTDSDPKVRSTAADGLDHWLTDNGAETCGDSKILEANLIQMLKGLNDIATYQSSAEILGARFAGESPLPCCMSKENRELVISTLIEARGRTPKMTIPRSWGSGVIFEALENISKCPKP